MCNGILPKMTVTWTSDKKRAIKHYQTVLQHWLIKPPVMCEGEEEEQRERERERGKEEGLRSSLLTLPQKWIVIVTFFSEELDQYCTQQQLTRPERKKGRGETEKRRERWGGGGEELRMKRTDKWAYKIYKNNQITWVNIVNCENCKEKERGGGERERRRMKMRGRGGKERGR